MIGIAMALLAAALASAPCFDRVLLKDGREIVGTLVASDDPAFVRLKLPAAEIPIPTSLVAKTWIENLEGYVPKNKQEEDYLKKGWVLFEGQWMSKDRRDGELKKRSDADRAAIAEIKRSHQWKNAVSKESPHFALKSNCDPEVVDDYLRRFEEFHRYFIADWGVSLTPGEAKGKMQVRLYRSYADWAKLGFAGGQIYILFNLDDGDISFTYDANDPAASLRTLYGAAFSQLSYYINPHFYYPFWLRSAMAAYYSTATVDEKGKFSFGALVHDYVYRLQEDQREGKLPPLREAVLPEEAEQTYSHTAVRWSFVHFLMESPKYGKTFKTFYGTLPKNPDAGIHQEYTRQAAVAVADDAELLRALEKRLGTSLEDLEKEWLQAIDYSGEALSAQDCFDVALSSLSRARDEQDDKSIELAFTCFEKADGLGLNRPYFYRRYAELLRFGGISVEGVMRAPHPPDAPKAWAMIQKAIALDPVEPLNYIEAGWILLIDSPLQDLDKAAAMAGTALAVAGSRSEWVKSSHDELIAAIEPAREARRAVAEAATAAAANDSRNWFAHVPPRPGHPEPRELENLKTSEVRAMIRSGELTPDTLVFQSWREADPETGQLKPGVEAWEKDSWIPLANVPVFAEDLAAAAAAAAATAAPGADGAAGSEANPSSGAQAGGGG